MDIQDNQHRNRILAVLFIGVLMGALDIAIVGPALPAIKSHFGVDVRSISWIFTTYVLFNLIGTPLMAKLSDTYGRRSVYVCDVALFAAGSLLVAFSPILTFKALLLGRAIQGFGAGGIFPVASAVIGDTFPPEKRGSALGLIGMVFGLAFIIGPILGGLLLHYGWIWLFLINLPIALVIIIMSWRLLPATSSKQRQPFDRLGMLVLSLFLASLTYGFNQIDTSRFGTSILSFNVWPFFLVALVLFLFFRRIEQKVADPILRLSLYQSRQVGLAGVISTGAGLIEAGLVFLPSLAVAALGLNNSSASFMLIPMVLAMSVGAPVVGKLLDRLGSKKVVITGALLIIPGMLLLSYFAAHFILFIGAGVIIGLGFSSLLGAPLRYIMLNEVAAADRAGAQGLLALHTSVGQLVGGAFLGAVIASHGGGGAGYAAAYLFVSALGLLLVFLALGLKNRAAELETVSHQR
jgi:EmrB/QacA subfamily drug resistance transporter